MKMNKPSEPAKMLEKGYRPIGTLNTRKPPQGGSAVPAKPFKPTETKSKS